MRKLALSGLLVLGFIQASCFCPHAVANDPDEVGRIAQTAASAQNAGDYEIAAGQWERIVKDHPDSSQIGVALYQAGFCYVKTANYAKAADRLKQSISKLDPEKTVSIAQAYLFLGYSQGKLGRELSGENTEEANKWLTTATETFASLLKRFPKFDDADQALFFQGDAYEALGRWNDAADSYSKMLNMDSPEFKLDGLFALGFIRNKQGQYDEAVRLFTAFENEGQQHPSYNEVRFRSALAMTELAKAAENRDDRDSANSLLAKAASKFENVYQSRDADWADQARFEQASCLSRLGRFTESAPVFESVVQIEGTSLADQARVYAGRDYMRSGNGKTALQLLEKSVAVESEFSPLGAHWLAQFYLKSDQPDKAYVTASDWVGKTSDPNVQLPLMLDKADAAYASDDRKEESQDLYLQIVAKFPNHRLAPASLYNAAYAAMETKKYADALALTKKFRKDFSQSDYLIDVLEVETDSYLLSNEPALAEKSANSLIDSFSNHPKVNLWKLNSGVAMYLQKKYQETVDRLSPIASQLEPKNKKAEAMHWIGSAYHKLGDPKKAIENLNASVQASKSWRFADETLLRLSQAFFADKQPEQARKITQQLVDAFPESKLLAEANYRLAEFDYESGNYDSALTGYAMVVNKYGDSQFAPYALYGIGWSYLQNKEYKFAAGAFGKLADGFPDHALAVQMLIGRASANRQQGKVDQAIMDIEAFLASDPADAKREEALYELGLAQIAKRNWPKVAETFEDLLRMAPNSELADRFHYELAWANKSIKNDTVALKQFATIADRFPESPLAAESNFHVGQNAYKQEDYPLAAKHFELAAEKSADASIKEKALYKLAWSHYKRKDFNKSHTVFQQQLEEFPQGKLNADAMFMVSESLYESNKFGEALERYRVAKPVIETSKTVSPNFKILTYLHGAQSANQAKEYRQAIEFAQSLLAEGIDKNIQQDAQMEIGDAYRALNDPEKATEAYTEASSHPGKTGARSMCMIGEILFDQKHFDEAINKFKLVRYGYGGNQASQDVKKWQAFACYEAGRCNMIQISLPNNTNAEKKKFVEESKKHFQYLVDNFPNDKLAPEANSQLRKLEAVKL